MELAHEAELPRRCHACGCVCQLLLHEVDLGGGGDEDRLDQLQEAITITISLADDPLQLIQLGLVERADDRGDECIVITGDDAESLVSGSGEDAPALSHLPKMPSPS